MASYRIEDWQDIDKMCLRSAALSNGFLITREKTPTHDGEKQTLSKCVLRDKVLTIHFRFPNFIFWRFAP